MEYLTLVVNENKHVCLQDEMSRCDLFIIIIIIIK